MIDEEKIRADLEGKNLNRVLPQVEKQITLQKERIRVYLVISCIALIVIGVSLVTSYIPIWLSIPAYIAFTVGCFSTYCDNGLRKIQIRKKEIILEIKDNG